MLACCSALACSLDGAGTGPIQTEQPAGASDASIEGPGGPGDMGAPAADASASASLDAGSQLLDGARPSADASADGAAPLRDGGGSGADAGPSSTCSAQGKYALRIDYDVRWDTTLYADTYPVFAAGSGKVSFLAQLTLRTGASGPEAVLAPCGTTLPDFAGGSDGYADELYNAYVPSASWNALSMPAWTLPWQGSCADPGCSLAIDKLMAVLGARLTGMSDASGHQLVAASDHDVDGRRGITYISRGPPELNADNLPYAYITLGRTARARKLDLYLGFTSTLQGSYKSCDLVSGEQLVGAEVEQHAWGCSGVVQDTTEEVECDLTTAAFLEQTLPKWQVTGSRFRAVRVSENSCNTVRATLRD